MERSAVGIQLSAPKILLAVVHSPFSQRGRGFEVRQEIPLNPPSQKALPGFEWVGGLNKTAVSPIRPIPLSRSRASQNRADQARKLFERSEFLRDRPWARSAG